MADITVTDREVNSFFVQAGGIMLMLATVVSGLASYWIWTDDELTNESVLRIAALATTVTLFFLSLGLYFVHMPKESMYEKKEEEQD